MENHKRTDRVWHIGLGSAVLMLIVVLVLYCRPEKITLSGTMRSAEQTEAEIALDLRVWKGIFTQDRLSGTVTVDGETYVSHKPANDLAHPGAAILVPEAKKASTAEEWRDDYVTVEGFTAGGAEHLLITRHRGGTAETYAMGFGFETEKKG
ncbi:MAG: hypothetical protein K6A33_00130 [Clostridiales bacterium]|nr:hypothetical protein [Clostridiales bacterium]